MFPNVTVTPVRVTGNSYTNAIDNRISAKQMTDLFFTGESESFHFVSKKRLLNLNPYIKAENAVAGGGDLISFESQFVELAWKIGQKNYDGEQMFVPRSSDRIVGRLIRGFHEYPQKKSKTNLHNATGS